MSTKRSRARGVSYVETALAVAAVVGGGMVALRATGGASAATAQREADCIAAGFDGCASGSGAGGGGGATTDDFQYGGGVGYDLGKPGDPKQNCFDPSSPLQCMGLTINPTFPFLTFGASPIKDFSGGKGAEEESIAKAGSAYESGGQRVFRMGAAPPTGVKAFIKEFSHSESNAAGAAPRHFFDFVLSVPGHNANLREGMQDVRATLKVRMAIDDFGDGTASVAFHDLKVKYLDDHETAHFLNGAEVDRQSFEMLVGQMEAAVASSLPNARTLKFLGRDIDLASLRPPMLPPGN